MRRDSGDRFGWDGFATLPLHRCRNQATSIDLVAVRRWLARGGIAAPGYLRHGPRTDEALAILTPAPAAVAKLPQRGALVAAVDAALDALPPIVG
jgi:hypothetical protein